MYGPEEAFERAVIANHLLTDGWTPDIRWTDDGPREKWTRGGDAIEIAPDGRVRSTLRRGGSLHDILLIITKADAAEYAEGDGA